MGAKRDWQRGKRISGGASKFVRYLKRSTHRAWHRTSGAHIAAFDDTATPATRLNAWELY